MQALQLEQVPLTQGTDGVIRVGRTRVTLETLVAAFEAGATPEEIVQQYPSVDLPGGYAVIAYVLANRPAVDAYLAGRQRLADEVRAEVEARFPPDGIRQRLLARRAKA